MEQTLQNLYHDYYQLLAKQSFDAEKLDYRILERHKKLLDQLDVVGSSAISIFDMYKKEHVYFSSKYNTLFGYDIDQAHAEGNSYADRRVHPDDMPSLLEAGMDFLRFIYAVEPAHRRDYKMVSQYRIEKTKAKYIHVMEQWTALELDDTGQVWLALSVMDMAPYFDEDVAFGCRALNLRTGERFEFPPKEREVLDRPSLSLRESEILQLISQGMISKEIADRLFISIHTVNTHRQRIIEKLNVNNTFEAITYASGIGLI